jgi:mannobiose 2-epimerase
MIKKEVREHLENCIIPFWKHMQDEKHGGYFGTVGYDLKVNKKADKGCILHSRILWFFSTAYTLLKDASLLDEAKHAYEFLRDHCIDEENGGVFWSIKFNGVPADTSKYTYNHAFAIYALSAYFEASGDEEALNYALELFHLIEDKCADKIGYKEAFDEYFAREIANDQLSENGIVAKKTRNTLLHIIEAYTELYRVGVHYKPHFHSQRAVMKELKHHLEWNLSLIAERIYNPEKRRLEVFLDANLKPLIDLHSYGHDIEAAWLIDRAVAVLENRSYFVRMNPISAHLSDEVYKTAFDGHSLAYENDRGHINESRVWWVQAEAVVGFLHASKREAHRTEYLEAVKHIWQFIFEHFIDQRPHAEWYSEVDKQGNPTHGLAIADEWKCPYHNGRMCFEVMKWEGEV